MLIETKGLKKTFKSRGKSVEAVRGVDLAVKDRPQRRRQDDHDADALHPHRAH